MGSSTLLLSPPPSPLYVKKGSNFPTTLRPPLTCAKTVFSLRFPLFLSFLSRDDLNASVVPFRSAFPPRSAVKKDLFSNWLLVFDSPDLPGVSYVRLMNMLRVFSSIFSFLLTLSLPLHLNENFAWITLLFLPSFSPLKNLLATLWFSSVNSVFSPPFFSLSVLRTLESFLFSCLSPDLAQYFFPICQQLSFSVCEKPQERLCSLPSNLPSFLLCFSSEERFFSAICRPRFLFLLCRAASMRRFFHSSLRA